MLLHLLPISSLMIGTAFLLLGSGLLSTLIALRGNLEGFSDQILGLMGSAYFVGFFIGTYTVPRLIRRMGHIRSSNFFSAAIAAFILLHSIVVDVWVWIILRIFTGIALVGFYTVIESWLNSQAASEKRGQVFAFYMIVNMVSIAAAQQFLHIASPSTFVLFSIAAVMVCFSVMPIASTRLPQPIVENAPRMTLRELWNAAPAAVIGALVSGLSMGTFWSMGPLYATRLGLDEEGVATLVSIVIIGGAMLQLPLGRISDRLDRRYALGLAATGATIAALLMALQGGGELMLYIAAFLYGGTAFAIYPIVVAHLVDHLTQDNILSGNAGILLLYGIGAMIGPALAGLLMGWGGAAAMPAFFAVVMAPLAIYVVLQAFNTKDEIIDEPAHFVPMVRTAETAMEIAAAVEDHHISTVTNSDSITEPSSPDAMQIGAESIDEANPPDEGTQISIRAEITGLEKDPTLNDEQSPEVGVDGDIHVSRKDDRDERQI
jgi:MFS family permease